MSNLSSSSIQHPSLAGNASEWWNSADETKDRVTRQMGDKVTSSPLPVTLSPRLFTASCRLPAASFFWHPHPRCPFGGLEGAFDDGTPAGGRGGVDATGGVLAFPLGIVSPIGGCDGTSTRYTVFSSPSSGGVKL